MRAPDPHPVSGLPARVTVYEVGPRDGRQNESSPVPLAAKLEFIERLAASGLSTIEATSFVSPRWVPQLADAGELYPLLPSRPGLRMPVLVPNQAGFDRAVAAGVRHIAVFGSATESFARRNLNRSIDESLRMFEPVVSSAKASGFWVRCYLSLCFGDLWVGPVEVAQVVGVCERLLEMGCDELSDGNTIGVATPGHVHRLLDALGSAGIGTGEIAVHFHDTYGQALANTLAALQVGVTTVDASAGGLGGCPYAASATGNLATEDLVWMLHGLGVETGVDLGSLVATSLWMARQLRRPSPSRVVQALAGGAGVDAPEDASGEP